MNTQFQTPRDMPRHPVISWAAAAKRLGRTKGHLWQVANGKRSSPRLLAEYNALLVEISSKK